MTVSPTAIKVVRLPSFYVINVLCFLAVLVSLVLTSWATHPADIPSRHAVDFTLLLTAVAYKFTLDAMLPNIPYLTFLDVYILVCLGFLVVATVCHTTVPLYYHSKVQNSVLTLPDGIEDEDELVRIDLWVFYVYTGAWALFNTGYAAVYQYCCYVSSSSSSSSSRRCRRRCRCLIVRPILPPPPPPSPPPPRACPCSRIHLHPVVIRHPLRPAGRSADERPRTGRAKRAGSPCREGP